MVKYFWDTLKRLGFFPVLWVKGGDGVADFERIYTDHFQNVYKYVFSLCRNPSLAEEVTQEAFYKAMMSIDKFDGTCQLYVWLCQIAKNTYFTYHQKQKRQVSEEEADLSQEAAPDFERDLMDQETARRLHVLLHQLPEPYKEVFSLRVFGELPFSQIGELFGKTDSWARVIFYRAKTKLRRDFHENTV